MPHGGGRKRATPRKAYAQKAAAQKQAKGRGGSGYASKSNDARGPGFSMFEAARNTEHRSGWGETKLRHTRIEFVSASSADAALQQIKRDEADNEESAQESMPTIGYESQRAAKERPRTHKAQAGRTQPTPSANTSQSVEVPERTSGPLSGGEKLFFIDTQGDASLRLATRHSTEIREPPQEANPIDSDDGDSDSSEEVVVFRGRNAPSDGRRVIPQRHADIMVVEEDIRAFTLDDQTTTFKAPGHSTKSNLPAAARQNEPDSRDDDAISDYLANIRAQQGGEDEVVEQIASLSPSAPDDEPDSDFEDDDAQGEDDHDQDEDEENDDSDESDGLSDSVDSEDEAPNESRLDRAATTMSDEQLARRLAKQEELGLGSDEILLWAEEDLNGMESEEAEEFPLEVLRHAAQKLSGQQGKRSQRRNKSLLPQMMDDFDALSDDYGDFDVLDFDRPSLKRRSKGSKELPFALSDSELEANMAQAWENDRNKKKQRKVQREVLRSQGLLGGETAQLRARYAQKGFGTSEVRDEIKLFISSSSAELNLVPMDKRLRKAVHEIANKLNLRSKSKGQGHNRYPCLYRTKDTLPFDEHLVGAILRRYGGGKASGRFNTTGGPSGRPDKVRRSRGGGGVTSGASYRDGETVGASAPVIGVGNRGHAMLAKMGWTTGTALGALDNKGSLEPIAHVVKSTRAGLG